MLCPRDRAVLHEVSGQVTGLFRCNECNGLWVSPAAFRAIGMLLKAPKLPVEPPPFRPDQHRSTFRLLCPEEGSLMHVIRHNRVELDVCPHCRGCWFDAKELKAVFDLPYSDEGALRQ